MTRKLILFGLSFCLLWLGLPSMTAVPAGAQVQEVRENTLKATTQVEDVFSARWRSGHLAQLLLQSSALLLKPLQELHTKQDTLRALQRTSLWFTGILP